MLTFLEILKQPLQTSVSLSTAEFDDFTVEEELHLSISVKDFKAIVIHADILGAPVSAMYSNPGRPMQVQYEREGLTAEFTLMTRGADITPTPQTSIRPASKAPQASPAKLKTQLTQREYQPTPRGLFSPTRSSLPPLDAPASALRDDRQHSERQRSVTPAATNRDVEQYLFFPDENSQIQPSAAPAKGLFDSDDEDLAVNEHRVEWDANRESHMAPARDNVPSRPKRRRDSDGEESVIAPTQAPMRGLLD